VTWVFTGDTLPVTQPTVQSTERNKNAQVSTREIGQLAPYFLRPSPEGSLLSNSSSYCTDDTSNANLTAAVKQTTRQPHVACSDLIFGCSLK